MKKIAIGILAHVDTGKTTLSEAMLYRTGKIRRLGRVDHKDAFLDTDVQERERGITIFSKQAMLELPDVTLTLLDTPGHVDFSAEMERTLQVLDYAVLVISAPSGVQGHTHTLWSLLRRYQIPTILFINKMDMAGAEKEAILAALQKELSPACVDFSCDDETLFDAVSLLDEDVMDRYVETERVSEDDIAALVERRRLFPCFFGSALHLDGVDELLDALCRYTRMPDYGEKFGARVFKIARDDKGARLTFLKVTGGCLTVKDVVRGDGWEEKADQLRLYSGDKFTLLQNATAGTVCAVTGLEKSMPGDALGAASQAPQPVLQPVLEYAISIDDGTQPPVAYGKLRQLEEEDPQLHLIWDSRSKCIRVQLMGQIQMQILQRHVKERFDMDISFDAGSIVYKETIAASVEGVGHYEPLRHYAEVHLLLEPGEAGSGLQFDTICSEDVLARNWQRLIFTHLAERTHPGVLTGSPITDLRITLLCGRAHLKHTEGGDFRQATYRAVRQGLKKAQSVLLEPWYDFRLELPQELVGHAITDIQRMHGEFEPPETGELGAVLYGSAPVAGLRDYQREVTNYTRGRGRLSLRVAGYRPCAEQETVVAAIGYDSERDLENPTGSVFCDHGAGFEVKWFEVEKYAHLPMLDLRPKQPGQAASVVKAVQPGGAPELEKELLSIFERTYGAIRRRDILPMQALRAEDKRELLAAIEPAEEYVLVDGYNILFAWDELKEIAKDNLDAARHVLMNLLCNYQGYRGCALILVFDAYKVPQGLGSVEKYHNIYCVYTKEAETADAYIERVTYELRGRRKVRVATSDNLEQLIILGHGAVRVSAQSFHDEVMQVHEQIARVLAENSRKNG